MRYFIDFEFIEGFHKPLFCKRRHFIDLISVGIYCEDGRTYHQISSEYNYNDADDWVKKNVIEKIYITGVHGDNRNRLSIKNFHKYFGKSNNEIAKEIYLFCLEGEKKQPMGIGNPYEPVTEFYGYYSDYDWVLFCSLFGRMIDLPKGFPMYCRDLKQTMDEIAKAKFMYPDKNSVHSMEGCLAQLKSHHNYPKLHNEHNALADAAWNYELYKFLQTF